MSHHEVTLFILAVGLLLGAARILGELARAFNQPTVVGEILAGIILGPTVFGAFYPDVQQAIFPREGVFPLALQGVTNLSLVFFMLVAGLEVDLGMVARQGRASLVISLFGMVIPFSAGFVCALALPGTFGAEPDAGRLLYALFFGTALAISALPVIAKMLMDLNIYRSDFGMTVIAVAIVNDLAGWLLFAMILGMLGSGAGGGFSIPATVALTVLFGVVMLTAGRWTIDRFMPLINAYASWPAGALGFAVTGALLSAAFTGWIGVHAIFGAFLFGAALGASHNFKEKTRHTLDSFISFIFAPLFFASLGLKVDFVAQFDTLLVILVIGIASAGKVLGCGITAHRMGFSWRESWALGVGLNARGAIEIVLALLALQTGLIGERMFVALVIMALFTSLIAGGLIQALLKRRRPVRLLDHIQGAAFVPDLFAQNRRQAIAELAAAAAHAASLDAGEVAAQAWRREEMISTGLGYGLATPHARIAGLKAPLVAVGVSRQGVDFDSPDGEPANLIFLVLTPEDLMTTQIELLADIARILKEEKARAAALHARGWVEFLAAIKSISG
ncbi:MAG: cation:proton antiporter [Nitrospinae bacterium]|nr:cation:proton antiporter [Nitrospinota bacterium]